MKNLEKALFFISLTNATIVLVDHLLRKYETYKSLVSKKKNSFGFSTKVK